MSRQTAWKPRKPSRHAALEKPAAVPRTRRSHPNPPNHPKPMTEGVAPASSPRVRIRWLIATVVVLGLGSAGFLSWLSTQSDAAVAQPGPPAVAPATAFRVTYRVDDRAGTQPQVETDVVTVHRPGDVRVEHWTGAPPGVALMSGTVIDGRSDLTLPDDARSYATPLTIAFTPELYSADALNAAVDAGKAEALGDDAVLGQTCTRYSYRHAGIEPLAKADDRDHVESCVTRDGILLREMVTVAGREVRSARAVSLDRKLAAPADYFAVGEGEPSADVQATRRVIEGPPSDQQLVEAPAPHGFHEDRRLTDTRQEIDGPLLPLYLESFVGGSELVVSEQYLYRSQNSLPWSTAGGSSVPLGPGRSGQVLYHTGAVEVQTIVDGFPVRVLAPRLQLARYVAGALRPKK